MCANKYLKKILFTIFFITITFFLYTEVFQFKFNKGSKQKIIATIQGKQYQNNVLILEYIQNYKTIRTVKNVNNNIGNIEDTFYFYSQNTFYNNQVFQVDDIATTVYNKDKFGTISLFTNSKYPTYRDVPVFPNQDIETGFAWTSNGIEVQDLFNDKVLSIFPLEVKYVFLGYEELNGEKYAKFQYEHEVDITNNSLINIDSRVKRIIGKSKTIMYFDNKNGTHIKEEYSRHYQFVIQNNNLNYVVELIDDGERIWQPIELMDKDKTLKEIEKKLKEDKVEETEVKKDEKGIKLSLENIHFYPDSSELLPGEYDRINKIANILKEYKDRGIMIIGHTTDKGTQEGRKKLSIERAKVIVDLLIEKNAIDINKTTFGGRGETEPIADNSTEEGMKKNRRVEIYILEE